MASDRTVGYYEHRWEGNFDRAVELLNRRSEHSTWFPGGCSAEYSLAQLDQFWLIDIDGRAVQPGFPRDSCGLVKTAGLDELKQLTAEGSTEHRIPLSDEQIYESWGCRSTYRPATAGTAPATALPVGNRFCRFSSGKFIGTVSRSTVFDGFASAPECYATANELASTSYLDTLSGQERVVTVELDGCQRVVADGYVPQTASKELLHDLGSR
ncbi:MULTISPECIES: hypothetical protein [unclassified Rhodococcus (in: high G+C Gram-positive bacteria)]|uniref:hypothetical protein n=1 Tax=unclassified Rhodococcus (in: high G+C Gram-positive bacteria) TaxID=192944 RepID=UPI0021C1F411|nr:MULTISPECIES: hypothetical protein [unclassified Rhodococcus (in: high G+C Gram-positive bacteria)]